MEPSFLPPDDRQTTTPPLGSMAYGEPRKRSLGLAESDAAQLPWRFGLAFLLAVALAEVVTALLDPRWGLVMHAALLVGLPLWAALRWRFPDHKLALAFTLIPLIRVLSLSLPLARFPVVTWYALTAVPLTVSAYAVKQMLALSRRDVGLTMGRWYVQILVALPGVAFGFVEYWILYPEPLIDELTVEAAWFPALVLLLATGLAEEFVFRGVLQKVCFDVLGRRGLLLIAVIFAALHVGYLSVPDVILVFIVGLYFAWATLRTGSILGVTVAHGLTNILLFLVIPFSGWMSPPPRQAPPQFPLALTRRNPVPTHVAPTRAPPTPTPTVYLRPLVTAEAPQEGIWPTPSPVGYAQETPALSIWGVPAPQPREPRPFERVFTSPVRLTWAWHRWLEGGEYFEVSLWSDDNLVQPVGTTVVNEAYCDFDLAPYRPGTYLWGVRVVKGHLEDGQVMVDEPQTMVGTKRQIQWGAGF